MRKALAAAVRPLPLALYRTLTDAAAAPIRLYLERRLQRGKEHPERFAERLGRAGRPRPPGLLAWLHGASVGEALSALPLILALRRRRPELSVLLTTGTVTSASVLESRLPPGVLHQFVPVDRAPWVDAFLDHWRPDLAVWLESELWPNTLAGLAARRVPAVLVNGRMSEASCGRWKRWAPATVRTLLSTFDTCLAQTAADADRLRHLGAQDVACIGNLKAAAPPLPADEAALALLHAAAAGRPSWLAASTHAGEEALIGRVHSRLKARHPGLLSVIVPRHAERGPAIADELRQQGLSVARRTAGEPLAAGTDVYLADTMGELGLFYRLSGIALLGKSLLGRGGQNPLEAARLGSAVLYGPHMENFAEITAALEGAGAARVAADEAALAAAVDDLLSDEPTRRAMGEAGRALAEGEAAVLERILDRLLPLLPAGRQPAA